jgi:hypothetical protein
LQNGVTSEATFWGPLQRRHVLLDDSPSKRSPEYHHNVDD